MLLSAPLPLANSRQPAPDQRGHRAAPPAPRILWLNPGEAPQPRIGKPARHHGHTLLPHCLFKRGGYYPHVCIRPPAADDWTTAPCPHPPGGYLSLRAALEQALTHGRALIDGTPPRAIALSQMPHPRLRNLILSARPSPNHTWTWRIEEGPVDLEDDTPATVIAIGETRQPTHEQALAEGEKALGIVAGTTDTA
jgi:hypothetical protein